MHNRISLEFSYVFTNVNACEKEFTLILTTDNKIEKTWGAF